MAALLLSWPVAAGAAATGPGGDAGPSPRWASVVQDEPVPEPRASAVVRLTSEGFDPAVVRIPPGGAVVWDSEVAAPHTVTAVGADFDAHPLCLPPDPEACLVAGGSVVLAFVDPGTYRYTSRGSTEGDSFTAEIVVEADQEPPTAPDPADPTDTTVPPDPTGTTVPGEPVGTTVPGHPSSTIPGDATSTTVTGRTTTTAAGDATSTTVPGGATTTTVPGDATTTTVTGEATTTTTTVTGEATTTTTTVPGDATTTTVTGEATTTTVPGDATSTTVPGPPTSTTAAPGGPTTTTVPGGATGTTVGGEQGSGTTAPTSTTTAASTTAPSTTPEPPPSTGVGPASLGPAHPVPHPVPVPPPAVAAPPAVRSPEPLLPWRLPPPPGPVAGGAVARPARGGGFPAHLQAMTDSVVRTGSSSTARLVDAVAVLAGTGVDHDQAVRTVFGRFPVGGLATYSHDWWFPRYGPAWRLHQGTDIFAPYGTPVRAPADGVVSFGNSGLGGLSVRVTEPDGTYWYLAHLSGFAGNLPAGGSVRVGDIVGYVGNSGNARGTPPHLHLEIHPGGGPAVDPKATLDGFLVEAEAATGAPVDAPADAGTGTGTGADEAMAPTSAEAPAAPVALASPVAFGPVVIPAPAADQPRPRNVLGVATGSFLAPAPDGRRLGVAASGAGPSLHDDPVLLAALIAAVGAGAWPRRPRAATPPIDVGER